MKNPINQNTMVNMFSKLLIVFMLAISLPTFACKPDSTAQVVIDNLIKYNRVTITSTEINPPYVYNVHQVGLTTDMYDFVNGDTLPYYNVTDTITGFFVWESGKQATCRYIDKRFYAKKVMIGATKNYKNTYGVE